MIILFQSKCLVNIIQANKQKKLSSYSKYKIIIVNEIRGGDHL